VFGNQPDDQIDDALLTAAVLGSGPRLMRFDETPDILGYQSHDRIDDPLLIELVAALMVVAIAMVVIAMVPMVPAVIASAALIVA
jgi:hypothetical protein